MQLAEMFWPGQDQQIRLARQIGITHAIVCVRPSLAGVPRDRYAAVLTGIKQYFESAGLRVAGVESHPVNAEKIKLGLPGRDEELENYRTAVEALGRLEIPLVCYNFMAGLGWYRTKTDVEERGGALTSAFDHRAADAEGLTEWGEVSEETIWANIRYFLEAIIPVAQQAGVRMALHPDDPPISPLRGIGRILTSAQNIRRAIDLVPSPVSGVTFCQASFKAMGEDIEALAREWCCQRKVFFIHFRDIDGRRDHFRETFHDNGPTDMPRMLRTYHESGFTGPIRPDHAPTLAGELNDKPGYAMTGKVLAVGYMKGIMDSLGIPAD